MSRWNTTTLCTAIQAALHPQWPTSTVRAVPNSGEDHTTTTIEVRLPGHHADAPARLLVRGFHTTPVTDVDDTVVEGVELQDGLSGGGGLTSTNADVARAYAEVYLVLVGAGVSVVPSLEDFF